MGGLVLGSPLPVDKEYDFWINDIITSDSDFCFFGNKPARQRFCAENKLSFFVTHWSTFVWRGALCTRSIGLWGFKHVIECGKGGFLCVASATGSEVTQPQVGIMQYERLA